MTGNILDVTTSAEQVHQRSQEEPASGREGNEALESLVAEVNHTERRSTDGRFGANQSSPAVITTMTREVREIADRPICSRSMPPSRLRPAGEQGRGFAVVADGVRKLAEKSARSAGEIDAVTSQISRQSVAVRDAIRRARSPGLEPGSGRHRLRRHRVGQQVRGCSRAWARRIAVATENQRRASGLSSSIDAITATARENDSAVDPRPAPPRDMETLASRNQQTVSRFRV